MEGYYGRERHETFDADGWYHTGDLFHVDEEGFFYFTGRSGDMIKTAGANVSPREVEAAILEADRTGRPCRRDRGCGARSARRRGDPAAAGPGRAGRRRSCAQALRGRLSAYKVPQRFVFLADEEVPMLSSGKLDSRALKERLACSLNSCRATLPALLRRNRAAAPGRPVVVSEDGAITHAELDDRQPRARRRGSSLPASARPRGSG